MANAGSATVAPGWAPTPGLRKLSSSKAWANVPNASAAFARVDASIETRHCATAGRGGRGDEVDDSARPRKADAEDRAADRVDQAQLGIEHGLCRQVVIGELRRKGGELIRGAAKVRFFRTHETFRHFNDRFVSGIVEL
jgi:hypothetical protein